MGVVKISLTINVRSRLILKGILLRNFKFTGTCDCRVRTEIDVLIIIA